MAVDRMSVIPESVENVLKEPMEGLKQKNGVLDRVLELLQDSQWHSAQEIDGVIRLPEEKLSLILSFFAEFGFVSRKGEQDMVKIKPTGLEFLELPMK
jgi:RIO-like serine/threonine protein kinase